MVDLLTKIHGLKSVLLDESCPEAVPCPSLDHRKPSRLECIDDTVVGVSLVANFESQGRLLAKLVLA